jgi:DNA-binding transcriptional MocR family regulator
LQVKLAEIEIAAAPEQLVLTAGVTQAMDMIARQFLRPGAMRCWWTIPAGF